MKSKAKYRLSKAMGADLQQEPFSKGAQSKGSWEGGAHTEEKEG